MTSIQLLIQSSLQKYVFILFSALILFTGCTVKDPSKDIEPTKRELVRENISDELVSEVYEIIFAIENKDFNLLNFYVHPTFGFYDVFKIDNIQTIVHHNSIKDYTYENLEEISQVIKERDDDINYRAIKYEDPKFDCSYSDDKFYGWSKNGLFLSADIKEYLTKHMTYFNTNKLEIYDKEDFYKAKIVEKTSYKVTLTSYIVFYITKLEDRFYITLFDRVITNCSKGN